MSERIVADHALTIIEILDLMAALDAVVPSNRWPVLKAVLCWATRHDIFPLVGPTLTASADDDAGTETATDSVRAASGDAAPGTPAAPSSTAAEGLLPPDDARWSRDGACGTPDGISDRTPAGPQVGPEDQAGASSAEPASEVGQGPEGAEANHAEADDAPVPRRAGGGVVWTDHDDRLLMDHRAAGRTLREIAKLLGRTQNAVHFRLYKRLIPCGKAHTAAPADRLLGDKGTPAPAVPPEPANAEPRPAAAGAPALAPAPDPDPLWFRTLDANLAALGYRPPFTPAGDLALVERLARGEKLDAVAADTGIARGALKARYVALTPDGVPVGRDQERLLAVLRHRAGIEMAQIGQAREAAE